MEMERKEYASKGVAGTALGFGIGGATLGLLNGLHGGRKCYDDEHGVCSDDHYVNRYEAKLQAKLAEKDSQLALAASETNTEVKIADVYERLEKQIRLLENKVNENTCGQAVTNKELADNILFVDSKFTDVYKTIENGDERLKCYMDCNFIQAEKVMPLSKICPPAMPACEAKK